MGTILPELLNFKNSVEGSISGMNGTCDTIVSSIDTAMSQCNSAKASASSSYNSENKAIVLNTFNTLSSLYSTIKSSVNGTLRGYISSSSAIISKVSKLEYINTEIENYQRIINNNRGENGDKNKVSDANQRIAQKNSEFEEIQSEAINDLNKLKSKSDTIDVDASSTSISVSDNDIVVEGGVFKEESYKASNGRTVNYYIYIPKVSDSTTKLPMLVYFHGMGDILANGNGIGALIQNKKVEPKGIVILPQAIKGTKDSNFRDKSYQEAVLDLVDDVAEKYNGDKTRVSVAGHSNGACAVFSILNNYPGKFAAAATLSGSIGNVSEGIKQTCLYSFMGKRDRNLTWQSGIKNAKAAQEMGYDALYKVYEDRGHDMQDIVFLDDVEDEQGNKVKLVDWLMSKKLKS